MSAAVHDRFDCVLLAVALTDYLVEAAMSIGG